MKILFTGDVNFRHIEPVDSAKAASILTEVQPTIDEADFRIVNLETPLADRDKYTPIHYVILCFHGGNEHNPVPGPMAVERYRLFCDMGADAVVAGHTHCHGNVEEAKLWAEKVQQLMEMPDMEMSDMEMSDMKMSL